MKITAGLDDLELEYFLRMKGKRAIVWKTKDGREIPIQEMSDIHLMNTIKRINRNEERLWDYPDPSDLF